MLHDWLSVVVLFPKRQHRAEGLRPGRCMTRIELWVKVHLGSGQRGAYIFQACCTWRVTEKVYLIFDVNLRPGNSWLKNLSKARKRRHDYVVSKSCRIQFVLRLDTIQGIKSDRNGKWQIPIAEQNGGA